VTRTGIPARLATVLAAVVGLTLVLVGILVGTAPAAAVSPPPPPTAAVYAYDDAAHVAQSASGDPVAASAVGTPVSLGWATISGRHAGRVNGFAVAAEGEAGASNTLFHYTTEEGQKGILDSGQLNPSLKSVNPSDARYGNGQYLSDIAPGTKTGAQLSRSFINNPFQGARFTNYVEINTSGLNVVQGRAGVFVVPGETPLDLTGRIVSWGAN